MVLAICLTQSWMLGFVVGISFGFATTLYLIMPQEFEFSTQFRLFHPETDDVSHTDSFRTNGVLSTTVSTAKHATLKPVPVADTDCIREIMYTNMTKIKQAIKSIHLANTQRMARDVRILCWVMTQPDNLLKKSYNVRATWGRHCNILMFISEGGESQVKLDLPIVNVMAKKGRGGLWGKTVHAFQIVHSNYKGQFDWVIKADDDTYVFVENLRHMLNSYRTTDPHYFGFRFKPYLDKGYMSGGAGYVLSKEALRRVVTDGFDNSKNHRCPKSYATSDEDVDIAKCLESVGVFAGDSRDETGRNRFFPFVPVDHLEPSGSMDKPWWYTDYMYWPMKGGLACCSDRPISFHYNNPTDMYINEYLAYHVRVHSIIHLATAPPKTS